MGNVMTKTLKKVECENCGRILIDKYFIGFQWWEVDYKVHISERHCKRRRSIAINKLVFIFYGKESLFCPEFLNAI